MTRYRGFCILDRINSSSILSFILAMDTTKVFESSVGFDFIRKWLLLARRFSSPWRRLDRKCTASVLPNGKLVFGKVRHYSTTLSFNVVVSFSLSFHARERYRLSFFFFSWRKSPQWAKASSFTRFLDHTQRRTTVGMTPLDEWSASRRDLYLNNTQHSQHTCMPPVEFEPTILAGERPHTYVTDRLSTNI